MHIVHLTSVHQAFDVRIFHKECMSLARAGYPVTLIAPHKEAGEISGIHLVALPKAKGRLGRFSQTVAQLLIQALKARGSVYHFHDPELIPIGLVLRLLGKKVIYDVHEDVPKDILSKTWIPARLKSLLAFGAAVLEWFAGQTLSAVITATPSIARRFPARKTIVIQNMPILGEMEHTQALPYPQRPPWVMYTGGIAHNRGIREMVSAMELGQTNGIRLLLAGSFNAQGLLEELSQYPGWDRVDFLGWQPRDKLMEWMGKARAGLVVLHPTAAFIDSLPIKLFEYMAAGLPVIASDFPLWRSIVEGSRCGILVDPLNPRRLYEAIQWLMNHPEEAEAMGQRGKVAVLEHYNWNSEEGKLLDLYRCLLT